MRIRGRVLTQVLAGLLYDAARQARLVDPDKVQQVLGVTPGEAGRTLGVAPGEVGRTLGVASGKERAGQTAGESEMSVGE